MEPTVVEVLAAAAAAAAEGKPVLHAIMDPETEAPEAEAVVKVDRVAQEAMEEEALLVFTSMLMDKAETSWTVLFNRVLLGLEV